VTFGSSLHRASWLLAQRLEALEARIREGEDSVWPEYRETARALAEVLGRSEPAPEYLTTSQMAGRLGVTSKTLLRRSAKGQIRPAVKMGKLIRWRGDEAGKNGHR
jgi:hypothetical protein